jgi:hypothetical protein
MTSPNFLSHIQHTGFIPQPGIGDVLGEQFRNLAQAKVVQTEMKQRQQQQDQLGEYYRGQNEEMMRLRDRQEAEARAQEMQSRQMEAKMAVIDKQFEVTPDMNERQAWDMRSKRALAMAEIGHPLAGTMSAILNSMRPKDDKNIVVPRDARVMGPDGQVLLDAAPTPTKGERGMIVETPTGQDFIDPITAETRRSFGPKPRATSGSGAGGSSLPRSNYELRLSEGLDRKVKTYDLQLTQMQGAVDAAEDAKRANGPAQITLINGFQRAIDPGRVTEEERNLLRSAQSWLGRLQTKSGEVVNAQVVPPAMVDQMIGVLRKRQSYFGGLIGKLQKSYVQKASRSGLKDPDTLFTDWLDYYGLPGGGSPSGGDASNVDKLLTPSKP